MFFEESTKGMHTEVLVKIVRDYDQHVVKEMSLGHNMILYGMGKLLAGFFGMNAYGTHMSDMGAYPTFDDLYGFSFGGDYKGGIGLAAGRGLDAWGDIPLPEADIDPTEVCADTVCSEYYSPTAMAVNPYCRASLHDPIVFKTFDTGGVNFLGVATPSAFSPIGASFSSLDDTDSTVRPFIELKTSLVHTDIAVTDAATVEFIKEIGIYAGGVTSFLTLGDGTLVNYKTVPGLPITSGFTMIITWRFYF